MDTVHTCSYFLCVLAYSIYLLLDSTIVSQFTIVLSLQTVVINRGAESIGMGIMGGSDRPTHVFRQGECLLEKSALLTFAVPAVASSSKGAAAIVVQDLKQTVYYQ